MSAWCGPALARRARGFAILRLPEDDHVNAMRYAIDTIRWPREINGYWNYGHPDIVRRAPETPKHVFQDCAPVRDDDPNPAIERDSGGRVVPGQFYRRG